MKEDIAISINYKASGGQLIGIDELVTDLRKNYTVVNIKPNGGAQFGGLFDFIINLVFNSTSEAFFKNIIQEVQNDIVIGGVKKYILQPFVDALIKFELANPTADYLSFTMQFDDISVKFYALPNSFHSKVSKVFSDLHSKREYYDNPKYGQLYEIVIPLHFEDNEYHIAYYTDSVNYSDYWGLLYSVGHERLVFDAKQNIIIEKDWS